jgi:hypothetical protein
MKRCGHAPFAALTNNYLPLICFIFLGFECENFSYKNENRMRGEVVTNSPPGRNFGS